MSTNDPLAGLKSKEETVVAPLPGKDVSIISDMSTQVMPTISNPVVNPQPTPVINVSQWTCRIQMTQGPRTVITLDTPDDARLTEWAKEGYKVYFEVFHNGVPMSGNTMRAEAAQAMWKSIRNGTKSPVPVPMPNERQAMGGDNDIKDILNRLVNQKAGA